jgi:transposase
MDRLPFARLIAPAYVKPFVKRQKNDAADAEAICEAAQRPSMRFVSVKTEEQQANGIRACPALTGGRLQSGRRVWRNSRRDGLG